MLIIRACSLYFMGLWLETLRMIIAITLATAGEAFLIWTDYFIDTIELFKLLTML